MRPTVRFLDNALIEQIISEARDLLREIGITIHNPEVVSLITDHGASFDSSDSRLLFTDDIIDRALSSVPASFSLYDIAGRPAADFSGYTVNFTPGSSALFILDGIDGRVRDPITSDYVKYARLVDRLPHIASQSTAFIPSDVHEMISDSYRLYLSLLYCSKPVITGAFTIEAFEVMKNLQLAVRGSEAALKEKPLTVFSCCPTSPLEWSRVTSQNVVDCARYSIPVEFVAMPLAGFIAPVTLVGTLIQHTAETISGIVISQLTNPGAPVLYGGSPASFDIRYETTPMGAVETEMIDCAYNEIGKYLHMPTQAYIALSDAKQLDTQAGLETAMGATMAALSGINSISGPGMHDFESCFSLEKLIVDNEICGMVLRMIRGIEPREDFPSLPRFRELLQEQHLLIAKHTRQYLEDEHYFPGPVLERANRARWEDEGAIDIRERSRREVSRLLREYEPSKLPAEVEKEMTNLMSAEARRHGMDRLPDHRS